MFPLKNTRLLPLQHYLMQPKVVFGWRKKSLLAFFRLNGQRDSIGNPLRKALPPAPVRLPSPFSVREAEEDQEETQVNGNASHIFTSIVGLLRGSYMWKGTRYFYIPFAANSTSRLILAGRAVECTRKVSKWAMHSLMS